MDPLPYFNWWAVSVGGRGGIKMASVSTPSANEQAKCLILVHTVKLNPMIKAQISGRMVSSGISDVASAHGENPSEEVDDDDENDYYESISRNDVFLLAPKIDFHYETEARKVMVDFKFDALYR